MQYKSIIFDMDGTLLDSMGMWQQLDRRFLRENGIEPPPDISEIVKKMTVDTSSAYFVERFHLPMTIEQTNGYKVQISFINLQKNADIAINERTYIYDRYTLQLPPGGYSRRRVL